MNLRIAAETLSNSVADSIEFLRKTGAEAFKGSEATVKFIRRINNIFDILNSKDRTDAICFKRPISPETKEEYFKYFDESIAYIKNLKLSPEGKSILTTKSRIAFFNFIVCMQNFQTFYETYVEAGILERIPTFHFSQDHLELLFSCMYTLFCIVLIYFFNFHDHLVIFIISTPGIRQMFGCNDNPSARQFESAWRKLLGQHQITASESANCMNNDFKFLNVLNASSRKEKNNTNSSYVFNEENKNNNIDNENDIDELNMAKDPHFQSLFTDDNFLNNMECHVTSYLASVLEKCIIERRWYAPITCEKCLLVFAEDESMEDEFVKLKMKSSKLLLPAKSTVQICMATECSMKKYNYEAGKYNNIQSDVLASLDIDNLFWMSDFTFHPQSDHKNRLIKLIIEMYTQKNKTILVSAIHSLNMMFFGEVSSKNSYTSKVNEIQDIF